MFMLRGEFEADESKGKVSEKIRVVLPEGIDSTSVHAVNILTPGKSHYSVPYIYNGSARTVTFDTNELSAVFYIYAAAVGVGEHSVNAYIDYQDGSFQPLGTARVNVTQADFTVPEQTARTTIFTLARQYRTLPSPFMIAEIRLRKQVPTSSEAGRQR